MVDGSEWIRKQRRAGVGAGRCAAGRPTAFHMECRIIRNVSVTRVCNISAPLIIANLQRFHSRCMFLAKTHTQTDCLIEALMDLTAQVWLEPITPTLLIYLDVVY